MCNMAIEWDYVFDNVLKSINKTRESVPTSYFSEIMKGLIGFDNKQLKRGSNWLVANHEGWKLPTKKEWIDAIYASNDIVKFGYYKSEIVDLTDEDREKTKDWAHSLSEKFTNMAINDGLIASKADKHNIKISHDVIERRKEKFRSGFIYCKTCHEWVMMDEFKTSHNGHEIGFLRWLEEMRKNSNVDMSGKRLKEGLIDRDTINKILGEM